MIKRNMNTPDLAGTVDINTMAKSVVEKFFSSLIRDEQLDCILDSVRSVSAESFKEWYDVQATAALGQLANFAYKLRQGKYHTLS